MENTARLYHVFRGYTRAVFSGRGWERGNAELQFGMFLFFWELSEERQLLNWPALRTKQGFAQRTRSTQREHREKPWEPPGNAEL